MDAYILDGIRTRPGGTPAALATVRPDDLIAGAIAALLARGGAAPKDVTDVIVGCASQAGEDCRNIGRRAALLAGLPVDVPGHDGQSPLRERTRSHRRRGAHRRRGRRRSADRGRRREHEPRAVRRRQGGTGVQPRVPRLRLVTRIAVSQRGADGSLRRSRDAGNGGARRARAAHHARGERSLRAGVAAEIRGGQGGRVLR